MRRLALKFVLVNCFIWALLLGVASCGGGGGTKWFPTCSLSFVTPNYAQVVDPSPGGTTNKLRWWEGFPLKVWIDPTTEVTGFTLSSIDLVQTGIDRWPVATSNGVRFTMVANQSQADIEITMVQQASPLGETIATVNQITGEVVKARIEISWQPGMTIQQFRDGLKATAAHEMGHALFIRGHSASVSDLMYWTNNSSLDKAISTVDMNTINTAYCSDYQTRGRARSDGTPAGSEFAEEKTVCLADHN